MVGCDELGGDESGSSSAAVATDNGFTGVNGLYGVNGITGVNGLYGVNGIMGVNGISGVNGLYGVNGLSTTTGLMTKTMGRRTVQYIASCALDSSQTLNKQDQYGKPYSYKGSMGLAPNWLNGGISANDEMNVSACLISRINSAGMHVPLWMVGATTQIGWGYDPGYPAQEGSYFGNVMRAGSDGGVHAYYCNGRDYSKALVPGRLGADDTSTVYTNPFGKGALCDNYCTKHTTTKSDGTTVVDGYSSCNGISNPITVWRKASYNPVFDDNYIYKLVSASSHLALDVYNWGTAENTPVLQYTSYDQPNQRFRIIQVATSQWKILDMNSGKALTNRNGSSANVQINSYSGASTDNWALDDHNGHFIIRNKATNAYLHSPGSGMAAAVNVTTSYNGAPDTDWDMIAVDSL
jgi:hypothetical protein